MYVARSSREIRTMDASRLPRNRSRTPSPGAARMIRDRTPSPNAARKDHNSSPAFGKNLRDRAPSAPPRVLLRPITPVRNHESNENSNGTHSNHLDVERVGRNRNDTGSFTIEQSDEDDAEDAPTIDIFRSRENSGDRSQNMPQSERMVQDRARRRLKFFFMNPWEKWKAKRKFPWKMILQILKVIVVTVQLSMFGDWRSSHVDFMEKGTLSFKHLYLENWTTAYETLPYPPASGPYAIYTIPQFHSMVDYALNRYNQTEHLAIGTYHFTRKNDTKVPLVLCSYHYLLGRIFAFNQTYFYDKTTTTTCTPILPIKKNISGTEHWVFDSKEYLKRHNRTVYFDRVINLELRISLKTIHLKGLSANNLPDCFRFDIIIKLDNSKHDGQMLVTLESTETPLQCHGHINFNSENNLISVLESIFDGIVILVSVVSLILTFRSIARGQMLRVKMTAFFKQHFNKDLTRQDKMEFLDFWYLLIIVNDVLTITGSILKIEINNKVMLRYDTCAVTLGTGALFVWFGVLRYFSFFEKYNILVITLKRALPNVLRFLLCAGILYLGFLFCGWLVLGPYHIKFRGLSTASECLFSLVNGDDMFTTFSIISDKNTYVWWYSRVYLYLFISLFIYVVLSVFISVIMDSYETIKYYYENGFPKSDLFEFVEQCEDDHNSPLYMSDDLQFGSPSCWKQVKAFFRRKMGEDGMLNFRNNRSLFNNERTPLIRPQDNS